MALNLANVELSDSFNSWRLRTNSIIVRSLQSTGTATSSANTTFSGRVTFSANATFSANTTFNAGIVANYIRTTGDIRTTDISGTSLIITGATTTGTLTATGLVTGGSGSFTGSVSVGSLNSGAIAGTTITGTGVSITGDITATGTITGADINSTSDARLKDNVIPIEEALSLVKRLKGNRFNWKESGKPSIGLIAQEVEEVLPEIINTRDDGFKTINYSVLVALLIEAIKELEDKISK